MEQIGLVIALRKTIMENVGFSQFRDEMKKLTPEDKKDLITEFNKSKICGANIEVVEKTIK